MTKNNHRIYLGLLTAIVVFTLFVVLSLGYKYYKLPLGERVYDNGHELYKPSGVLGHGYGIAGSLLMITGVSLYMARKRFRAMSRIGLLKHWLEIHIFLCTLGPLLILFHTAFKFGGLVAVSFWSMVAVFFSGILGRFIYLQIPRTIEGRIMTLNEIRDLKNDIVSINKGEEALDERTLEIISESVKNKAEVYHKNMFIRYFYNYINDRGSVIKLKDALKAGGIHKNKTGKIISLVKQDISINRRIERLDDMQNLFKYWHVAHLPFALVMLIIMIIHVSVTIIFGYRWIF